MHASNFPPRNVPRIVRTTPEFWNLNACSPAWILYPLTLLAGLAAIGVAIVAIVLVLAYPNLPSRGSPHRLPTRRSVAESTADGAQISEFGEERRNVVHIDEVPAVMKQAILAAEDDVVYQHSGIDALGMTGRRS